MRRGAVARNDGGISRHATFNRFSGSHAGDVSISKGRSFTDTHIGGRFADGRGGHSSLTVGATGNHFGGSLSIDRHGSGTDVHGGLFYSGQHYGHDYGGYSYPYYGSLYHSFGYGYPYYTPYYSYGSYGYGYGYPNYSYGYSYDPFLSSYYTAPYTYPYIGVNYYVDAVVDTPPTVYDSSGTPSQAIAPGVSGGAVVTSPVAPLTALDRLLRDGQGDLAAGRYDDARRTFAEAMFVDENDGVVKLLYAIASFGEGDFDLASIALRRALSAEPGLIDGPVDVLALLPDRFEFQTRVDRLADLVGKDDAQTERKLLLGYLYFGSGRLEQARTLFDDIVTREPGNALAQRLLEAANASSRP